MLPLLLKARLQPAVGWGGHLSARRDARVHSGERLDADVVLERAGGDLHVTDELGSVQPLLGLAELRLALSAHDGLWQFAQGLAGSPVGNLAGAQLVTARRRGAAGPPREPRCKGCCRPGWPTWAPGPRVPAAGACMAACTSSPSSAATSARPNSAAACRVRHWACATCCRACSSSTACSTSHRPATARASSA